MTVITERSMLATPSCLCSTCQRVASPHAQHQRTPKHVQFALQGAYITCEFPAANQQPPSSHKAATMPQPT